MDWWEECGYRCSKRSVLELDSVFGDMPCHTELQRRGCMVIDMYDAVKLFQVMFNQLCAKTFPKANFALSLHDVLVTVKHRKKILSCCAIHLQLM
ncbi:unnamed protein product [Clavelina lepadiformis]|uniref:Uncharacterized protein n=1 Tax=Clavelina lepadiformis TaxID=159417 RepID=A0ABP0GN30_CLALP